MLWGTLLSGVRAMRRGRDVPDEYFWKSDIAHHHRLECHEGIESLVTGVAERCVRRDGDLQHLKEGVKRWKGSVSIRAGACSCLITTIHAILESENVEREDV